MNGDSYALTCSAQQSGSTTYLNNDPSAPVVKRHAEVETIGAGADQAAVRVAAMRLSILSTIRGKYLVYHCNKLRAIKKWLFDDCSWSDWGCVRKYSIRRAPR